jgi:hypothetical protein
MDRKYSDFIEDGPIVYLGKLDETELKAIGERNRVHFIWPKQDDPRGTKAEITWSNKLGHQTVDIDPSQETNFYINDLAEASYIFEIRILDNNGHNSIPVTVTATVYGAIWESYLSNRNITGNTVVGTDRVITYKSNVNSTLLGTEFEWKQDGQAYTTYVDSETDEGVLENFKAMSFRYRTKYIPEEGGIDVFYSPWSYYVENITTADADAGFDKPTNTFTLPIPNDGNWLGYELRWTDKTTGEARSQSVTGNIINLSNYNALAVNIMTLYKFDDVNITTIPFEYSTVRYVDLDRSGWYIAPETRVSDGTPISKVNDVTALSAKNQSPYLSHQLPYNASSPDGDTSPRAHIDGNTATYLSQVKGWGTGIDSPEETGGHSNGGVSNVAGEIYFIIDLGAAAQFNYFRVLYRLGQSNGNLKPQAVSFYGSNDPNCITDPSKWTAIQTRIAMPNRDSASTAGTVGESTGNTLLPECSYRYLKMRYDEWTSGSNTMQIAEFYLGLYN